MNPSIILCVDDDTTVLSALRTLLGMRLGPGHLIEIAESGEEALELHAELQAQGREISVVISDYIMPGMRGDELLVQLHQRSPQAYTMLLTGQSDLQGVKRATNEAKLYQFIEKPFNNEHLVDATRRACALYRAAREREQAGAALRSVHEELAAQLRATETELERRRAELERATAPLDGRASVAGQA